MLEPSTRNETIAILKRKTEENRSATRRDRVELAGLGFSWPNASITHRLENTLGYNPVRLALYEQATGAKDTVGLPEQRVFTPLFPSYKSQLADLLGLRYIATGVPLSKIDPQVRAGDFPVVAITKDGFIYENPRAFPRVIFANASLAADFDEILNTGRWPEADLQTTVLLKPEDRAAIGLVPEHGPGDARITSYSNTLITVDVDSNRGGFLVLNDVWQPWWTASVDGETKEILRANVLFRAVRVPKGRHTVRFEFQPVSGALGSLASSQR
jgi:Bacterial membrane protein YfhO